MTATAEEFLHADANRKVGKKAIEQMAEAMLQRGIEPEMLGRVTKMKMWQGMSKDGETGEPVVTDLYGFHLAPTWEAGPEWPVVAPAAPVKIKARPEGVSRTGGDGWQRALILPDIQAGYFRSADDRLEPIHDIAAIEVALSVLNDVQPDTTVMLGDNLDLPEFGKYRQMPAFSRTTQMAVDYMHRLCSRIPGRKVWLAGNHEERLPNFVIDNAKASFGLKQANTPDGWPVLSVPHLCRLDETDTEYIPGYPAGNLWLNKNLRIVHGYKVKSNGQTAYSYLANEKVSVIYGHIHRREWAEQTRQDHTGPATVMAASPGCLARTDGVVPGVHSGHDLDGRPMNFQENWQQGFAVVEYHPDGRFSYQQVAIHQDGDTRWCRYDGKTYEATFDPTVLF